MTNLNLGYEVAILFSTVSYGAVYGILVGFFIWLALRIAEPTLPFRQLTGLLFGWMISWMIGLAGILGPFQFNLSPRIFALIAGFLGGLFTASACGKMQPRPGLGRFFIILLAWPLGQFVVWNLMMYNIIDFGDFYARSHIDMTGAISSAIAGALTLLMLGIPRKE